MQEQRAHSVPVGLLDGIVQFGVGHKEGIPPGFIVLVGGDAQQTGDEHIQFCGLG